MSQQPPWQYDPPAVPSQFDQQPSRYRGQPYYAPAGWQEPGTAQYAPPPRRRRGLAIAAWIAAGIALLAVSAGATVMLLRHNATVAKPLTCKQQYAAWKTGPARPAAKKIISEAKALTKANDDIPVMLGDLKAIGADADSLQAYPMPACADPKGYWPQYLADLKAAGDNAGSASGLAGLLAAEAPLKNVKTLQRKLSAELAKTAGVKAS